MFVIFWLNLLLSNSCFNWLYLEVVSEATLVQKLTVFVTSFADLSISSFSSPITFILFICKFLLVTLSKLTFLSSVIFFYLVYSLLNLSLNCLLKIYNCEHFIILFLILLLIVFDSEPETVAVAKAVGIY